MKNVADSQVLDGLIQRLERLTPDSERRWGTLTAAEALCHLGDAGDSVLRIRIPPGPPSTTKSSGLFKWLALYSPMPWPKGVPTRPGVNPKKEGTRPGNFAEDRARVVNGLRALAIASGDQLSPAHFRFGPMSLKDWQRWAYKHVDHHMRQFGL